MDAIHFLKYHKKEVSHSIGVLRPSHCPEKTVSKYCLTEGEIRLAESITNSPRFDLYFLIEKPEFQSINFWGPYVWSSD